MNSQVRGDFKLAAKQRPETLQKMHLLLIAIATDLCNDYHTRSKCQIYCNFKEKL